MLSVFRSDFRKTLMKGISGYRAGLFGGDEAVLQRIAESGGLIAAFVTLFFLQPPR